MPPVEAKPEHPRRRLFQYSLRSLLALMLIASAGLGWLMHER